MAGRTTRRGCATIGHPKCSGHLVTALTSDERHRRRAALVAAVLTLLGLCAAVILSTAPESASAARAKLLGKTKGSPRSQCPKPPRNCQAVGRLTGFQVRATKSKNP